LTLTKRATVESEDTP